MFWKVFWGIWIVLAVLCIGFFMYYLATLPEVSFLLEENKTLSEVDVTCSSGPSEVTVVWEKLGNDGKPITESFSAPGSGFLNLIKSRHIQESRQGRELFITLKPFWLALYFFWSVLFVSTIMVLRYIFKTLR